MKLPITIENLSPAWLPDLIAAQHSDDGHCAPLATHVFIRGSEVVGAAGIGVPTITFWAHRARLCPRESLDLVFRTQTTAAKSHEKFLCLCQQESPFHPLMSRFGFERLGTADVFQMPRPSV